MVELMRQLRALLVGLEPGALAGAECVGLVSELALTEKACAAARVRLAVHAASTGAHRSTGFRDAHEWLARKAGCSSAEARSAMATASALADHPVTASAVAAGEISMEQSQHIVAGAAGDTGSELELLAAARTESLQALAAASRKKRLARIDPEELAERQRKAREFRHWIDDMGMVRFRGGLAPADGVALMNRLDAEADRLRRAARAAGGELESREAYAADALVSLTNGSDKRSSGRVDLVVVVDSRKFDEGDGAEGPCHIIGAGPVPVAEVRRLATRAFMKLVSHDGVDIHKVKHVGRYQPAELRTALNLGAAPEFE
ncbi:MAG: protein of unknown function endonuclease, partial [Acidimicrobiia bacterium]|nr:protein of unknown function endonuclease [Acidimicrobiia bacterium]